MASGMRLRKGDEVMVITGKDRGKRGRVQEVRPRDQTVIVAGVNIAKHHTKANPTKNQKGGIIEQPMPLGLGKVMVVCPHCGKPTRVAHRTRVYGRITLPPSPLSGPRPLHGRA